MSTIAVARRADGRLPNQLRPVKIVPDYLKFAEGSVLIRVGDTRVVCAATIEDRVPPFLRGKGAGWVTAEYSILPRAGTERSQRGASTGRVGGRTHEIQRLIGRSLRTVIDLARLGERTITLDCDVIQADGGTRTASITGAFVALGLAMEKLVEAGTMTAAPIRDFVAAVSVGIVDGNILLDLCYEEDSQAEVDLNFVMTSGKKIVEVQATAEQHPFDEAQLKRMMEIASKGIESLIAKQRAILQKLPLRQ